MKKLLVMTLLLAFSIAIIIVPSNAAFGRTYTALKATPIIDGEIDDAWEHVEWTSVDKPYDGADYNFPEKLRVKLLWDENNLYFLAEITDSDVNFDNDLFEIYVDEGNEKATAYDENDHQTRFKKDGSIHEVGTQPRVDSKAVGKDISGGWIIEGALDWVLATHKEGDKLGLEFMFNIGDSANDFTQALRWNVDTNGGDTAPWQSTEFFGELTLGAPVPEPIVEVVAPVDSAPEAVTESAPAVVATKAAQTNDNFITVTAVLVIFGLLTMVILKKKVVK